MRQTSSIISLGEESNGEGHLNSLPQEIGQSTAGSPVLSSISISHSCFISISNLIFGVYFEVFLELFVGINLSAKFIHVLPKNSKH